MKTGVKSNKNKTISKKPFMTREEERKISWQRKYTRFTPLFTKQVPDQKGSNIYQKNSIFTHNNKTIEESSDDCITNFGQK
jgi:hypothetical protein